MFCYQCEQTAGQSGCTRFGVCGKEPTTSDLQDVLTHLLKGISWYAHRARKLGKTDREVNVYTVEGLFTTVTNVNFDAATVEEKIREGLRIKEKASRMYEEACNTAGASPDSPNNTASFIPATSREGLLEQAEQVGISRRREKLGEDVTALQ